MARGLKQGLDYFSIDVDIDVDDKWKDVDAEFGTLGYGLLLRLFTRIYRRGYYYQWDAREKKNFLRDARISEDQMADFIQLCLESEIFDRNALTGYNVLTSRGIQKRYVKACERRKEIIVRPEIWLLTEEDLKKLNVNPCLINVNINSINVNINSDEEELMFTETPLTGAIDNKSTQSKVKERESINNSANAHVSSPKPTKDEIENYFNECWKLYPKKTGKASVKAKSKEAIYQHGDEVKRAIERYLEMVKTERIKFADYAYQGGDRFFNTTYLDYMDDRWAEDHPTGSADTSTFVAPTPTGKEVWYDL